MRSLFAADMTQQGARISLAPLGRILRRIASGFGRIADSVDQEGVSETARTRADQRRGFVSLVGAGPGSRDLLTLRAVQRLQDADAIFYDRLVDPDLLRLARPGAELVYVGKAPGAHLWTQSRIDRAIVAAGLEGKRVVRLKSGDPGIFGRAAEEIAALNAAGLPWEIVPGVTAASAAAASGGSVLTERGVTDTLVFATATSCEGKLAPDLGARLLPGTTLAIYMGASRAQGLAEGLLAEGHRADLPVEIVHAAETPDEARRATDLAGLARDGACLPNPLMIFIRAPLGADTNAACGSAVRAAAES